MSLGSCFFHIGSLPVFVDAERLLPVSQLVSFHNIGRTTPLAPWIIPHADTNGLAVDEADKDTDVLFREDHFLFDGNKKARSTRA